MRRAKKSSSIANYWWIDVMGIKQGLKAIILLTINISLIAILIIAGFII